MGTLLWRCMDLKILVSCSILLANYLVPHVASNTLFDNGKEYQYSYLGLFTTGTEEPASYASSYMLVGKLRIQGNKKNSVIAKLEDMKVAMYNGRWSYFPVPQFNIFNDERLSVLEDPFELSFTDEGKFKSLSMGDLEPEYASNIKRGLATYLQLNLSSSFTSSHQFFQEKEMTTMGECPTSYEITPDASATHVRVAKFRSHEDCPDVPKRIRQGTKAYHSCPTDKTRDLFNSTSYATYDLSVGGSSSLINQVTIFSSILYWPFTSGNQFLYTWFNVTLALTEVGPIKTPIPLPENAETHEDLTYVFEQSDYEDQEEETPDIKTVEPLYFHQASVDADAEMTDKLISEAKAVVNRVAISMDPKFDDNFDTADFHSNSPLEVSKILAHLDQDSLKIVYSYYSNQTSEDQSKERHKQLIIDGLMHSGTTSAVLVLRDIIMENIEDNAMMSKILPYFPHYIRVPSEALVKEFDGVFNLMKASSINSSTKQLLELSLATLVSRGCARNLCQTTALLQKYIHYFEENLNKAISEKNFNQQTYAVVGLRNIGIGNSLDKLQEIVLGNITTSNTVRVQAIWGIRAQLQKHKTNTTIMLLPVFYNRSEPCEIRTSVFGLLMSSRPEKRLLHEIAYYMWSETCPQTLNIVRSTFTHLAKAKGPCASDIATHMRTILKYLPPGKIDTRRTTSYGIDYFDETVGVGRSFYMTAQKSGDSLVPVSIYAGSSHTMGGFCSSPFGIFVRMEGLDKFLVKAFLLQLKEEGDPSIIKVLSDLNVKLRNPLTFLKLEVTVLYLDRVIYQFIASDAGTLPVSDGIRQVQDLIKVLTGPTGLRHSWEKSLLVEEVLYEQPLEVGIPISIYTSAVAQSQLKLKSKVDMGQNKPSRFELDAMYRSNVFVTTSISNHASFLGTVHSAGLLRTSRIQEPLHLEFLSKESYIFYPPSYGNPVAIQNHATGFTSLTSETPGGDADATGLLKKSCSNCGNVTFTSSGVGSSKTIADLSYFPYGGGGMLGRVKTVACEKDISKFDIAKRFRRFFSSENKNTGIYDSEYAKIMLGLQQASDYLVTWPKPEPCGFQIYFSKASPSSPVVLDRVEGKLTFSMSPNPKGVKIRQTSQYFYERNQPTKNVDLSVAVNHGPEDSQEIHFRYSTDAFSNTSRTFVGCIDLMNYVKPFNTDPLGYEGADDPQVNQTITVKGGTVERAFDIGNDSAQCPSNHLDMRILGVATRSQEQIAAAVPGASKDLSYLLCNAERIGGNWPSHLVPPTPECFDVLLDQTRLRSINMTIRYKGSPEFEKRCQLPFQMVKAALSPYLSNPDQSQNEPIGSKDPKESIIKLHINLSKKHSSMNIFSTNAKNVTEYYEGVDYDVIPSMLHLHPVDSRIPPLSAYCHKHGCTGSCAVSANSVVTFDNKKYPISVSNCETLVAADCRYTPSFAVYAKSNGKAGVNLRISILGKEVIIAGDTVSIPPIRKVEFNSSGEFQSGPISVTKKGKEITVKTTPLGGIRVRYAGGHFVQITLHGIYRGMTCGLCGNFDSQIRNDLQGPTTSTCPQTSIVDAWTIKAGSCAKVSNVC